MDIKFYGHACFSVEGKTKTLVMDPFEESIGLKLPKIKADVVTISHEHPGHQNAKAIEGEPKVFRWPGEYETKGIHFKSIHSLGHEMTENNIFVTHFRGIRLCHLGALVDKLSTEQLEHIGDVDILFLPVGGKSVLDAKKAKQVMEDIEPRIVIPMLYGTEGDKSDLGPLAAFLSEVRATNVEPVKTFSVKKSELPEDTSKVVVLEVQK